LPRPPGSTLLPYTTLFRSSPDRYQHLCQLIRMNTDLTIARTIQLPEVSDYQWLREEILKYIEALGSRLWTDYNVHDPGITIADVDRKSTRLNSSHVKNSYA